MLNSIPSYLPMLGGIIVTLLGLVFLIITPHELGHWFIAQLCRLRTTEFSIGFGTPRCCIGRYRGTNFYISLWLIGGYVMIPQLNPECFLQDVPLDFTGIHPEDTFISSELETPIWKRLLVTCAGVFMNAVMAVSIMFLLYAFAGQVQSTSIDRVISGNPAATVGLLHGDRILSVNGVAVTTSAEVIQEISKHPNELVNLTIQRNEKTLPITVRANSNGKIGAMLVPSMVQVSMSTAAYDSLAWVCNMAASTMYIFPSILKFLAGEFGILAPVSTKAVQAIHGPIGIVKGGSDLFQLSWYSFVYYIAYLNVAFAVINILPIPITDGGHVVLLTLEKFRRKQLGTKAQSYWATTGILLLGILLVLGTWNDFMHPLK